MSQKIFTAIPKIMKDLSPIAKGRTNSHQGYKFRGIEDMYNAIQPVLVENSVFCVPQVLEKESQTFTSAAGKTSFRVLLKVSHKFYAEDGSYIDVITLGEGIDTSDKATNKSMSAAMKYAFIELFSIPTEDIEDSDKESPEIEGKKTQQKSPASNQKHDPTKITISKTNSKVIPFNSDASYIITIGKKFNGKRLSDVDPYELNNYLHWLKGQSESSGKPIEGKALEFVTIAERYLDSMDVEKMREKDFLSEEFPQ